MKRTRHREFLDEMHRGAPWSELVAPFVPEGKRGRPLFPVESLLRLHFMQQWATLSDQAMEEALHDMPLLRGFADLGDLDDQLYVGCTTMRLCHALERNKLAERMRAIVDLLLGIKCLVRRGGTVVDVALISAQSSTKSACNERDLEMQRKKRRQRWCCDMKAHYGLVHSVRGTAAHVNHVVEANHLRHGQEINAFADARYQGANKPPGAKEDMKWHVAIQASKCRLLDQIDPVDLLTDQVERIEASVHAKAKYPFRVIKRQFGHMKVRYCGLARSLTQLQAMFAQATVWMMRKRLVESLTGVRPAHGK